MTRYWEQPRPYIDGERFTGQGRYWRPQPRMQGWFFLPPEVKAATWWSVAWTATTVLAAIRIWQALTEHDDEIGD